MPSGRRVPEVVDGDLVLMDANVLAQLRGEINRIKDVAHIPQGVSDIAAYAIRARHSERQHEQAKLCESIALLAGLLRDKGYEDRKIHRHFFHRYKVDVLTAQTLGASEAIKLKGFIDADLLMNGVIPKI